MTHHALLVWGSCAGSLHSMDFQRSRRAAQKYSGRSTWPCFDALEPRVMPSVSPAAFATFDGLAGMSIHREGGLHSQGCGHSANPGGLRADDEWLFDAMSR